MKNSPNFHKKLISFPHLESQGIKNKKVLKAIRNLPRELFVPTEFRSQALSDQPLPIDCGQTISQPFIVAYMTEQLELKENDRVLEIGTGSGFQAGVLAQLAKEIYTVEIYSTLSQKAQTLLTKLGYNNINYKVGNGQLGWPESAPFDAIIITALAQKVPLPLLEQLKVGGKMILPLKSNCDGECLFLITKKNNQNIEQRKLISVRFVPLI